MPLEGLSVSAAREEVRDLWDKYGVMGLAAILLTGPIGGLAIAIHHYVITGGML